MAKQKAAPATEVLERIDPEEDEDFSDVDGDLNNEFALSNQDPDKHYVWVHNDRESIGQYKSDVLHYDLVHATEGGAQARSGGFGEGELVTARDHVLMACSKARFDKKQRFDRTKNVTERKALLQRNRRDVRMERGDDGRWAVRQGAEA